jgi:cytochrome c2
VPDDFSVFGSGPHDQPPAACAEGPYLTLGPRIDIFWRPFIVQQRFYWSSRMKKILLLILAVTLVLAYTLTVAAAGGDVEKGKAVYEAQKCKMCHSIAGVGNKKSPLDGIGSKLSADDIKKWIADPKGMKKETTMKAYKLPDADLDNLVSYMLSLKK